MEKTKVIFRKFKDGSIIAMFPEIPANLYEFGVCMSYQHVGQHSGASIRLIDITKLAKPKEYNDLKNELENVVGYDLEIYQRITPEMHNARHMTIREYIVLNN